MRRRLFACFLCIGMLLGLTLPAAAADSTAQELLATAIAVATDTATGDTRTLQATFGSISVTTQQSTSLYGVVDTRSYDFGNAASCTMARLTVSGCTVATAYETLLSGTLQKAIWLDESSNTWKTASSLAQIPQTDVLYLQTSSAYALVYSPKIYETRDNQMLEEVSGGTGTLSLQQTADGLVISWQVSGVAAGMQVECLAVVAATPLIDWSNATQSEAWKSLLLTGDNRWTYDGYYYRTPSTYSPTGDNYFHRIPSPYIATKLLELPQSQAAVMLSVSMLDVMLELMNDAGYYPTYAQSNWLLEDYGIAAGYFDTRWNADLTLSLLDAYAAYGIEEFKTYAVKNGEYWLSYIAAHAKAYTSADGSISGLLVEDYGSTGASTSVHTSLNHQVTEILMLYRLGDLTGNASYTSYAGQLLNGIRAVGTQWIASDGDLWYRINADGTLTGSDYPYLTYNDLYKLQAYLQSSGRGTDSLLTALMASKRSWMDANGVTGYLS